MSFQDDEDGWLWSILELRGMTGMAACIACLLCAGFVFLMLKFPVAWAVTDAVVFIVGAGLFTTRTVLGIREGWKSWAPVPLAGSCLLLFFWVVFKLNG